MFIMAFSTTQCYNIRKSIVESELMMMYRLILYFVTVAMAVGAIIRISENPWKTACYLMLLLTFWDVFKNYIRKYNDK